MGGWVTTAHWLQDHVSLDEARRTMGLAASTRPMVLLMLLGLHFSQGQETPPPPAAGVLQSIQWRLEHSEVAEIAEALFGNLALNHPDTANGQPLLNAGECLRTCFCYFC